jgi:hypothetical protein
MLRLSDFTSRASMAMFTMSILRLGCPAKVAGSGKAPGDGCCEYSQNDGRCGHGDGDGGDKPFAWVRVPCHAMPGNRNIPFVSETLLGNHLTLLFPDHVGIFYRIPKVIVADALQIDKIEIHC